MDVDKIPNNQFNPLLEDKNEITTNDPLPITNSATPFTNHQTYCKNSFLGFTNFA